MEMSKEGFMRMVAKIIRKVEQVEFSFSTNSGVTRTTLSGKAAVEKMKELVAEAKSTRIVVRDRNGIILFNMVLMSGVVGGGIVFVAAPVLSVAVLIVAKFTKCTVSFEVSEAKLNQQ